MTNRSILPNLTLLLVTSVACDFIADFDKESSAAGGKPNNGGSTNRGGSTNAGASSTARGGTDGNGTTANGGVAALGNTTGTGATSTSLGGTAGTGNSMSLGGAGGGFVTGGVGGGITISVSGAGVAVGGATSGGVASTGGAPAIAGTSSAGAVEKGGSANGGAAAGGATSGGTAGKAGATGGVTSSGGVATGGSSVDVTTPRLISISPGNGATGVLANAAIALAFSEPMDKASVAAAVSMVGVIAADLTLRWNSSGSELTIEPKNGLEYASGTNPTARSYTVTLSAAAKDLAGNAVGSVHSSTFSTMRRVRLSLAAEYVLTLNTYGFAMGSGPEACYLTLPIGLWYGSSFGGSYWGYVGFDTTALSAVSGLYDIESAILQAYQSAPTGDFYNGHVVELDQVSYVAETHDIPNGEVLRALGTFSNGAGSPPTTLDVVPAFKSEFLAGHFKQLYRLRPAPESAGEVRANFDCGRWSIGVVYLAP